MEVGESMKISEEDINHNITRLIDDLCLWDLCGDKDDTLRTMACGYIAGLTDLGSALKEVLKA